MTDPHNTSARSDAATTPVGITTICPQCGASLDALTTSCARCGAVISLSADGERAERLRARLQGQIGQQYQLGGLIGRGGMGIVFKARELSLDREVALKVLAFDPVLNPEAFARFEREAKLAARLDHPNIVPIFSVGQGDGVAYYTMRFVRGGSLEAMIARDGLLTLDHAVRLLRETASALDFAHAQGVVHRDVKPGNILLSDSGHAMVADFGIARAFSGENAGTTSSSSQTGVVGSPAYMAPEQWRGERPDGRADQYALAVMAYELLAGQRPFREPSMQELLQKHLQTPAPSIDTVKKGLPSHVGQAIRRAMSKDPADRFATATEFVQALAGETEVGAVRATKRKVASSGSRRWLGWSMGSVIAALAIGALWRGYAARTPVAPAAAPTPALDTLAERLARELEETKKIALQAEARAARAERESARNTAAQSSAATGPKTPPHGHVGVLVRGGAPQLIIDDQPVAGSTPAIVQVPTGQHVVRVMEAGKVYLPRQMVIDVADGDTSRLEFYEQRTFQRQYVPGTKPSVPGQAPAPEAPTAGTPIGPTTPAGAEGGAMVFDRASSHPYYMDDRFWSRLSAAEQERATKQWSRMTPEQQQRVMVNIRQRTDSVRSHFPRLKAPRQQP